MKLCDPRLDRRTLIAGATALATATLGGTAHAASPDVVSLDRRAPTRPFPHSWEACVGSDRASVAFRAQWQEDLGLAHRLAGFRSVRFHGLFDDDMGVCQRIGPNGPELSFLYVDQIFDKMLEIGVRPFVELSFMPPAMASSDNTIFWYKGNTSPPRRMSDWAALVAGLARHCIDRYGLAEVETWRFECWNEPNLNFWAADQAAYFELYAATARALKAVHPRLQVGGPATAQLMWIADFLDYCGRNHVPVDFVSSHIYADDPQENLFGRDMHYPREEVMPRAMARARAQIVASPFTTLPLVISEWSSQNPAFIAQMVRDCSGLCDTMSYWTFDNIFEEQGPLDRFDNAAYGLIGWRGVARPSFQTFALMHRLGEERLETGNAPVIATRRTDGSLAVLAWNLITDTDAKGTAGNPVAAIGREPMLSGPARRLRLRFGGGDRGAQLTVIDPSVDAAKQLYESLGRPASPTAAQLAALRTAAELPPSRALPLSGGTAELDIPANGVVLVEIAG